MNLERLLLFTGVVFAAGCTSSSGGAGGAADAGATNDWVCGAGTLNGTGHVIDPQTLGPVPGAVISGPGCNTAVADDRGYLNVRVPQGQVVKLDATLTGRLKEHTELTFLKSGFTLTGDLFPDSTKTSLLTGWTEANGYVAVIVGNDGSDGGPCASAEGAVVSVKGHPEIAAGYLTDLQTRSPTLTATGPLGFAVLGPIPPGTYEVDATKTGCHSIGQVGPYLQFATSMDVVAGTLTAFALQLSQ